MAPLLSAWSAERVCRLRKDEGFLRFLSEINDVALKYMQIDAADGSKTRQITPISAPTNEQVR